MESKDQLIIHIKEWIKIDNELINDEQFTKPKQTTIKKEHFEKVVEGMERVYTHGTASFLQVPDISICGKTNF